MKKIPFDEDFFSRDNEQSFYWAGLLAADGNLRDEWTHFKNGSSSHRKAISLGLIEKDMIELFLENLNCKGRKIEERWYKTQTGENCIYTIKLSSSKMFKDLARFGLKPKKSLVLKMPRWLQKHPLVHHFIRGYFDGDGSVSQRKGSKYLHWVGTKSFLSSVNKIIKKNIDQHTRATVRPHSEKQAHIFVLSYTGNNLVKKVSEYLYKDATIWLERKHTKIMA